MPSFLFAFPSRDVFAQGLSRSFYDSYPLFREIYEQAGEFLKEDLVKLSYAVPDKKPEYQMACLLTHCYGIFRLLQRKGAEPAAYAGFSQGEFTALCAAGCLPFPDILKLIVSLDKAIMEAPEMKAGAMARVVGLGRDRLQKCCEAANDGKDRVSVAVCFSYDQNVISGSREAVEAAGRFAKKMGARWVIRLPGTAGFHSPLCREIGRKTRALFDTLKYARAVRPVYLCATGKAEIDGSVIKKAISSQIFRQVVWDRVVDGMDRGGINMLIELGPGCSVSGNTRIINPRIGCMWVNNVSDMEKAMGLLARRDETAGIL